MRSLALAVMFATGCRSIFGIEDTHEIDAFLLDTIGDEARTCVGGDSSLAKICMLQPAVRMFSTSQVISTDDDTSCDQLVTSMDVTTPSLCVITGASIGITGQLTVIGSRPIVLAALDTISVTGTLDASSSAMKRGAGADDATCMLRPGTSDAGGGGGGAGGTFGGKGGNGGDGDTNDSGQPSGTSAGGGSPNKLLVLPYLRGGCIGGDGGSNFVGGGNGGGGPGGHSGGAVYLLAGTSVDIGGNIFAAGAGGQAGPGTNHGAGGGGSGGAIAIEAPMVVLQSSAIIAANGAGGGGGTGTTVAASGDDGTTMNALANAAGGTGDTAGGGTNGGGGSSASSANGNTATNAQAGAGGGGGGVGFVWVRGTFQQSSALVSPTPQVH